MDDLRIIALTYSREEKPTDGDLEGMAEILFSGGGDDTKLFRICRCLGNNAATWRPSVEKIGKLEEIRNKAEAEGRKFLGELKVLITKVNRVY